MSMTKYFYSFLLAMLVYVSASAQSTADYAVQITATTQTTPPKITLTWKPMSDTATIYYVYRKGINDATWPAALVTLAHVDTTYVDTAVIVDSAYEYQVIAVATSWQAAGYIYAGIKNPAIHSRGGLIMMVDSTFTDSCSAELHRLMKDLSGDGWQIFRHDVARGLSDTSVKSLIQADYTANPGVNAVLLVGHVAVPYSGDLNPDAHPNHLGAWPADVYYGVLGNVWTDMSILDTVAGYTANWNILGDGKWDQTTIPGTVSLQIGRIDFNNMPAFGTSEVYMMKNYLGRDHIYKMDSIYVNRRALISDNFGPFSGEAFAANGYRNFAPLLSRDSINNGIPFISSLNDSSFLWAYGCGGGSFGSAGGIGSSSDFATNQTKGIFTMLFGSYFGDWNVQDNFLRAPLCSPTPALTCCWAGRPNWYFHHMSLGQNIGFSARVTQNNDCSLYGPCNYGSHWVHVALMGDLSLRMNYIKPITSITITKVLHHGATVAWTASPDANVIGYYVYRSSNGEFGKYNKISGLISTLSYHDTVGTSGLVYYMVRPVKLQGTPSGGYYNLGIGVTDSATVSFPSYVALEQASFFDFSVYPNPASNNVSVSITSASDEIATVSIVNLSGQTILTGVKQLTTGTNIYSVNICQLPAGTYAIMVNTNDKQLVKKWVKL